MEVLPDRAADGRSPGRRNFGDARLGDRRRTAALADAADRFVAHPHGSLPQKLGGPAATARFYKLLKHGMVTHASVLAPHAARTRERMAAEPVVLVLHDTTELDYTGRKGLDDELGQIGNGSRRGLLCHNSLAVTPAGRVLGLANQVVTTRRDVPDGEPRAARRAHPDRESRLWLKGLTGCGDAPPGVTVVDVSDRGSDTLEYLHAHRQTAARDGRHVIVRSQHDRPLDGDVDHFGDDRRCLRLREYAARLPALGVRPVRVHANGDRVGDGRDAVLSVAAGPLTLAAPSPYARGEHGGGGGGGGGPLELWCVYAREVDPPPPRGPGVADPVEWLLLTDLPCRDLAEASLRLDWYARRPLIEELHRAKKQGMGVERLRLASRDRLEPAVALLSASAAILLDLRQSGLDPAAEHEPASAVVPMTCVAVVSAVSGVPEDDLTTRRFALEVAKLGGYLPRGRGNGRPGWITLWRGWERVTTMVEAVEAMKRKRSG